jgi:glycosyltransferase involved in cell wall biosynthesis
MRLPDEILSRPRVAFIGCWFHRDIYSHNCSNLVNSLHKRGVNINVVTSNCRCFSSAQRFDIATSELINTECVPIRIRHAPRNPGRKDGLLKYLAVRILRLDVWLALLRGFLYHRKVHRSDIIHYDQVLEAFGAIQFFVLLLFTRRAPKRLFVTVHEIDSFQRRHLWINRLYNRCAGVIVYSDIMKSAVVSLGVNPEKVSVTKYGVPVHQLPGGVRTRYIFFGGHNILSGKGYISLLEALAILKARAVPIRLLIYVGHGCNGAEQAHALAARMGVDDMIEWSELFSGADLASAYQTCKACIIPYTAGSARHPVTTAMANATPVIGTRFADIPEYLGSLGIYVDGSGESVADAICDIEKGRTDLLTLGTALRQKAIEEFDFSRVAAKIESLYAQSHC